MCRSEAAWSTAILSRSLTCISSGPGKGAGGQSRLFLSALEGCGFWGLPEGGFPGIDVGQPAVRIGYFAVDDVEEALLQGRGHRAGPAAADLDPVHRAHGCDFGRRPHEENLIGQ